MNKGPMATKEVQKPKNFKKSIKQLFNYNKPFMVMIIIALVLSMVGSILSIIGPDKLKDLANTIGEGMRTKIDLEKIKTIGYTLVILYGLSFVFNYLQGFIMATVTNKFSQKIRSEISSKINRLPLSYFDNSTVGDILSRVTNDVDTIGQTMNQSIGTLMSAVTSFIGALVMMITTNWIMAITAVLSTFVGFTLMIIILKSSQKYFSINQQQLGKINGHVEEVYSGHNVVKVYNGKEEVSKYFDEINSNLYEAGRKSQFYSGLMMPIMNFIGNFGYVSVCIVGAILVMNDSITFGVIVAFMMYIRLFTNPLSQMAQSANQLQSTAAASERVFEFLNEKDMNNEKEAAAYLNPKEVKGNIEFKKVNFGYSKDKPIIKNFSANIKAGQKIAIVGPTGAGKTTIVNLLMKFYDIDNGDIIVDGVSIKELTRENIHSLFCMVLQDTWLFEGTIKDNVRYNQKDITDKQIVDACKVVGLDHFIRTLPDTYNSVLNDTESLSSGQKQLFTIARAILENEPFLILDEATSSVDTRTEILVQNAMDKLTEGRTSFIIAHRLSTIKNADLILVMKDGNIIEQGNHNELMNKSGFYADLYNSQFNV